MAPSGDTVELQNLKNGAYMLLNSVTVLLCVATTKLVFMPPYNFSYVHTLVSFHFFWTWACGQVCQRMGLFDSHLIPTRSYLKLACSQVGAVCLINLSLMHNSMGMYQVLKFGNIALICLIEFVWLGISYQPATLISLAGVLGGIYITVVTELEFSLLGFLCGLLGAMCAAIHQVLTKHYQSIHSVSAMQLLHPQAAYSFLVAALFALVLDPLNQLMAHDYTPQCLLLIVLSGTFAFLLNLTCYLVIGRTSPVTFGVAGCLKTVGTVLFGILVLHQQCTVKNAVGILLATGSSLWYAQLKLQDQKRSSLTIKPGDLPHSFNLSDDEEKAGS
eukprot:NODE_2333_length_1209_cov_27.352126_g2219_i0.p1 GENE.NODE_2333_length_1209_cov_27.352126_g2219_i0~~NODE_2333_length_1209_cov_27.352126_g2219_i0.p1  ORF type:complete len:331 (+),score=86.46 NODE_2333_length_1209_cov_27.352126_g2219_i0:103-1095(+)